MATVPRRIVGSMVEAKACHVTNLAECARRYGSNSKTKRVQGVMTHVEVVKNPTTNRTTTFMTAAYDLGGTTIRPSRLNIRSVKAVSPPTAATVPTATGTLLGSTDGDSTTTEVTTPPAPPEPTLEAATNANTSSEELTDDVVGETPPLMDENNNNLIANNNTALPEADATAHDQEWFVDDAAARLPVNGNYHFRNWAVKTRMGYMLGRGGDHQNSYSRIEYFLMLFPPPPPPPPPPPEQQQLILQLTNHELGMARKTYTSAGEIVKFFGVMLLATRFEFGSRASLWSNVTTNKYIPAPSFGQTGMPRKRFDDLWMCIRFSEQPPNRPSEMTSEQYRWRLVDDFVKNFNEHRAQNFFPSDEICVDESMSRWYGQGGHWINHGLPMYVAIDRKPENGCEIQNAACGRSGVMLRLKIVKTAEEENASAEADDDGNNHGTNVLKFLVEPWVRTDRCICADSYFASVNAVTVMRTMGLRFIGVVKTATKKFPMSYLSNLELVQRGDYKGLVARGTDGQPTMLSFVWMDRDQRYFVASASSLDSGVPYSRNRWRQVSLELDALPENVELTIPQPKAAEVYYRTCGVIDQHNRHRQDNLKTEKKLQTKKWDMRVNLTIFSMIVVDTWLVYSQATGSTELQSEFYVRLAEELIDNNIDSRPQRQRNSGENGSDSNDESPVMSRTGRVRAGVSCHLTPTKRRRRTAGGELTVQRLQGRCIECGKKTTYLCSACMDKDDESKTPWLCHTEKRPACFANHYKHTHLETYE